MIEIHFNCLAFGMCQVDKSHRLNHSQVKLDLKSFELSIQFKFNEKPELHKIQIDQFVRKDVQLATVFLSYNSASDIVLKQKAANAMTHPSSI
jgi:hypothetical protein